MSKARPPRLLRPNDTCWRVEHADRLAVIIDAADYFATIRQAICQARHSVMFIAWDFDARIMLDPRDGDRRMPNRLGPYLNWAVRQNPDLNIHVLQWNLGWLSALGRGTTPLRILRWMMSSQIHYRFDSAHPAAAAHHQKIVVIDDALAFCGGIDMTADRWDTRDHPDQSPYRRRPTTHRRYGPWHDVTTAVDGAAARALGDLARTRWERATGERLQPPPPRSDDAWPKGLTVSMRDVDVGIARTMPEHGGHPSVHEIESLYLAVIAATRRTLYIESQYFASHRIAEALAARLREPDSPEFVIINPESAQGWLEEKVMGSARAQLMDMVRKADRHDRFRIYTPVTRRGTPIYVHAKVLVMDDWLLRVGSSNLNNRSLGFDTECDLAVEANPDDPADADLRQRILGLRHDLLAEHLDVPNVAVESAVSRAGGSLIGAIDMLRGEGRTLVPFEPPEFGDLEQELLAQNPVLDPERPARNLPRLLSRLGRRVPRRTSAG